MPIILAHSLCLQVPAGHEQHGIASHVCECVVLALGCLGECESRLCDHTSMELEPVLGRLRASLVSYFIHPQAHKS